MPLPNRVDPAGELCAVDARGLFMGNRGGRFHTADRQLTARRYVSRRWIICVCAFKNRQRKVWGDSYTELFFLDEVTALAAGQRPCFECRRADAKDFMTAFPFPDGAQTSVDAMDRQLHSERLNGRAKRLHTLPLETLPDGAMFLRDGSAHAVRGAHILKWSHNGYGKPAPRPSGLVDVLTPPSTLTALRRGFVPVWRPGAN